MANMPDELLRYGDLRSVSLGRYLASQCGRCGYVGQGETGNAVGQKFAVLAMVPDVMHGEPLCLKCLAEELGDPRSATHK
jgi:hypothetical protein